MREGGGLERERLLINLLTACMMPLLEKDHISYPCSCSYNLKQSTLFVDLCCILIQFVRLRYYFVDIVGFFSSNLG
jgi:hypothetical protein